MDIAQQAVHLVAATVGFLSFFLLWLAIIWGLVLRNGWASTRIKHSTAYGIHQTVALLGLTLAVVHAGAQLATPGGTVRLIDEFVPFLNPVDPLGIGVGVVGLEAMLAAALSIIIQRRLGYSRWRALHAITYVAFMLVVAHVLISGSDVGPAWVWGSVLIAWLVTVLLWLSTTPWLRDASRLAADRVFSRRRNLDLTVNVDPMRCKQFGFCEHEAPDVFQLRSDGRLSYAAAVPADRASAVVRAAEVCPARAIMLNQMPTAILTPRPRLVEDTAPRNGWKPTSVSGPHRNGGSPKGDL